MNVARRQSRRRRSGFTLLEVLATLLLLAIVLPAVMKGYSMALAAASTAKHTAEASSLAQSKLNDLLTQGVSSASGLAGDFSPEHPEYQWSYQSAPRDFGVTEVRLIVTWLEQGRQRTMNLSTLTYSTDTTGGLP